MTCSMKRNFLCASLVALLLRPLVFFFVLGLDVDIAALLVAISRSGVLQTSSASSLGLFAAPQRNARPPCRRGGRLRFRGAVGAGEMP